MEDLLDTTVFLGHGAQEKLFLDLFENDTLPHAMIFAGLEGIGKTTMAFRLAKFLFKHGKEEEGGLFGETLPQDFTSLDIPADDPVAARIESGGHADLLHIARHYDAKTNKQDAALKVDALRKIEPFLRKTSSEGGWRIVIVEDADTMNRNAQNAILKILEEPPKNVLIMLIAHSAGALIPTIRSRARMVNFDPLSQGDIQSILEQKGHALSMGEAQTLSALCAGSVGGALRLIEEQGLDMLQTILTHLNENDAKIHSLANDLGKAAQDRQYRLFVQLVQWIFRQMLFFKARGESELPSYLDTPALQGAFKQYSLENLITVCDDLKNHFERTEFSNLDRRDAVRSAFLMMKLK